MLSHEQYGHEVMCAAGIIDSHPVKMWEIAAHGALTWAGGSVAARTLS